MTRKDKKQDKPASRRAATSRDEDKKRKRKRKTDGTAEARSLRTRSEAPKPRGAKGKSKKRKKHSANDAAAPETAGHDPVPAASVPTPAIVDALSLTGAL